jgi:hypothetical protein
MEASHGALEYSSAGVAVRGDLRRSHREILLHIARPGPWFTGAERVSIAAESRNGFGCPLCQERKQSLSPEQPDGDHGRVSELPEAIVEICHRIRSDSMRLSKRWFERMQEGGIEEGAYVEIVGIVAFTAGLDHFCRALGIPQCFLPEPLPGEPSGHRPANMKGGSAWVSMLAPGDAGGPEANLYDSPMVPNIARALSLVPDHVRTLQHETASHYVALSDLMNPGVGRDLDRLQMELVAARVSALNECFY